MSFYLLANKKYPLISLMERPTALRRPTNQKGIKGTVMQIKNKCYLIAVGLYPETFAFQLNHLFFVFILRETFKFPKK